MKIKENSTYKQTRELLELARTVNRRLADLYRQQASSTPDERVCMLMEYMQRHEKQMNAALSETMETASEAVLDTYYQFEPEEIEALLDVEHRAIAPDADLDEAIAMVRQFDDIMRSYYARAEQMADSEAVARIFRNLKHLEEEKRNAEVRDALFLKDI